ncbi:MAG TPA: hypothetical protein VK157_09830 [Phycisphaerales bacterium]|nr:hypothetical protein [Phycisphaerales bacterium]
MRGQVATWHARGDDVDGACCPLEGTCSECGLRVEWRLVMRPELIALRWFVETERPPRKRWSSWRTAWRALRPWSFWHDVRMETAFDGRRLRRWVFACAVGVASVHAIACVLLVLTALLVNQRWRMYGPVFGSSMWDEVGYATERFYAMTVTSIVKAASPLYGVAWIPVAACGLIMPPVMLLALPFTRAQSKVRARHIARAAVYAMAPVMWTAVFGVIVLGVDMCIGGWGFNRLLRRLNPIDAPRWSWGEGEQAWWFVLMVWFVVWWGCAFKIGFRMPDWKQALAAVMVPTLIVQGFAMSLNLDFSFVPGW